MRIRPPRAVLLIAGVAACVIASKLLVENAMGIDLGRIAARWVAHAGAGTAMTVVTLLAIDIALPVPSSLVMVLSGAAFGVVWGSLLSLVGSVSGEWLGFEVVRRYGRSAARGIVDGGDLQRLERVFARHGVVAVCVSRALPVVMETLSVVAGLARMPRATFLTASVVGTAPIAVIYAYAGAVSRRVDSLVPAAVIIVATAAAAFVWYRAKVAVPLATATEPTT